MKPGKRKVKDGKEEFFLVLKSSGRYDDSKDEQNVDNYRTIMDRLSELVNENDMQILADIVYNDVNIQVLFSGSGLFLALVNVFGFYLIMVSQDRSA